MFCKKCGAFLPEDVKFCIHCGAPLVREPEPAKQEPNPVRQQPAAPVQSGFAAPGTKRSMPFVLLLFALASGVFLEKSLAALRSLFFGDYPFAFRYYFAAEYADLFLPFLLLIAAVLMVIWLADGYQKGARPVPCGIAFLCTALALAVVVSTFFRSGLNTAALFRHWINIVYAALPSAAAILFIVSGILAFAGKRFLVTGLIGSILFIAFRAFDLFVHLPVGQGDVPPAAVFSLAIPFLFYLFFALGLLLFSLKYRPTER